MSDEKALLATIWEHPHDDTPRLVYADWLQENGQPEHAEFIRVQIEMWRIDPWDDRMRDLRARAEELRRGLAERWRTGVPAGVSPSFVRGFSELYLSDLGPAELFSLRVKDLRVAPLSRYEPVLAGTEFETLLKWPGAVFQNVLTTRAYLKTGWTDRLARCNKLRNVSELSFTRDPLAPGDLKAVLDTWADRYLRKLKLECPIGDLGAAVVAGHRAMAKVRELDLRGAGLKTAGVRSLGRSLHFGSLRNLHVQENPLGDSGVSELAGAALLAAIRNLDLGKTQTGDAGTAALANSPAASNLRWLILSNNQIGPDGLRALARSPFLGQLHHLSVGRNPGLSDAATVKELADRFGDNVSAGY